MKEFGSIKAIHPRMADVKLSLDEDEEIDTLWLDLETAYEYTRNGKKLMMERLSLRLVK